MFIFVRNNQNYNKISISFLFVEQVLEICSVQIEPKAFNLILINLYIITFADFNLFIKRLDTLKYLYNPKSEFLIYHDINDYLNENNCKKQPNSLLKTYHFSYKFCHKNSNDFSVGNLRLSSSSTSPIQNGLSDHVAQCITINNTAATTNLVLFKQRTWKVNNKTITQFQLQFINDTREFACTDNDTVSLIHFCILS
jgi:hypothetical protein